MSTAAEVLRFLARVVGESHDPGLTYDVRRHGPVATSVLHQGVSSEDQLRSADTRRATRQWRKVVTLHAEEEIGRRGQLWLAGTAEVEGRRRSMFLPLVAHLCSNDHALHLGPPPYEPTRLAEVLGLSPGMLDAAVRTAPGAGPVSPALLRRMPRLAAVATALARAGLPLEGVAVADPSQYAERDGLWLCHHIAVYVDRASLGPPTAQRLHEWAGEKLRGTALEAVYDPTGETVEPALLAPDQPRSPLPLTDAQRAAVLTARTATISVVSGAPGTGKSHVAVAIALDTIARGGSVLLATRSAHAADVLAGLLDRHPGPTPVRIGGGTTRRELADRLAGGLPPAASGGERDAAAAAEEAAAEQVRALYDDLARLLAIAGTDQNVDAAREALLRTEVPAAFTVPYAAVAGLLAEAETGQDAGWIRRWLAGRASRRLRARLGAAPDVPLERVRVAVELGRRRALAAAVADAGGLDPAPTRAALVHALDRLQAGVGHRLSVDTAGAADRAGRRAVAGLAAALRAGPRRRAEQLTTLDATALTRTLPLWVGTVSEIEQLLPRTPGMFDLVVLDEASQLDQIVTAPVLARARRAVVGGDPRQLRHVSFVADAEVDDALAASGLTGLADRLDVRRVSAFDAAAAAAPVQWLDEHLRSVPHLIAFSAERFYDRHLHVTTLHPSVATQDAIDTLHVQAGGDEEVVVAEVDAVLAELDGLASVTPAPGTVGVVTPFRAQADALETALVERFDLETIERLGLRVGTVHGFQGGERDIVIISLGLTEDHPAQRRTFAEDPHLVNVMVTRARRRILVVTALPAGTGGLLGAYLDHAERPPSAPAPREPADDWTRALLEELLRNGHDARPGDDRRHGTDLVVGRGDDAVGLLTRPHPAGVDADVARHAALRRAGWDILEAYATPADQDPVGRVLDLRSRLPA